MTGAARNILALLAASVLALAAGGCDKSDGDTSSFIKNKFAGKSPSEQLLMLADANDPDNRREAIVMLSGNKWGLEDKFLKAYATILKSDPDVSVRCAAVKALGKARNSDYLPDIAAAMDDESHLVRWDAAVALDNIVGEPAVLPLVRHAMQDSSEDVRVCCLKALRHYPRNEPIKALIQCLADPAFSIRYQAHQSLVEMTGEDYGTEADQWSAEAAHGARHVEPAKPWWDWAGVTQGKQSAGASDANARPWWDWMGVTNKSRGSPASQPAEK